MRVLTPFQCNRTKKHWEPHRERGYHLNNVFFFVFLLFLSFFFFFCNKIIIFNLNDKIMEKEPLWVLTPGLTPFKCNGTKNTGNHKEKEGII